jgi:hypothetical protein
MCSSRKQFYSCFEVDQGHILQQGLAKNQKRLALNDEDIASIVRNGELNIDRCETRGNTVQIAVEGLFKDFSWIDYSGTGPMTEKIEPNAQIRVIVRERKPKHLVVTAYVLDPPENRVIVEVSRGIW